MARTKKTAHIWKSIPKKKIMKVDTIMQQNFNCLDKVMVRRNGDETLCVITRVYDCNHHGERLQPNLRVGPRATRNKANRTHRGIIRYCVAWEDANGEGWQKRVDQHELKNL